MMISTKILAVTVNLSHPNIIMLLRGRFVEYLQHCYCFTNTGVSSEHILKHLTLCSHTSREDALT